MTVLLFARARDLAGAATVELALPAGATVADLRRALASQYPKLAPLLQRSALAVDDCVVDDASRLALDAVVALLPPVSGG